MKGGGVRGEGRRLTPLDSSWCLMAIFTLEASIPMERTCHSRYVTSPHHLVTSSLNHHITKSPHHSSARAHLSDDGLAHGPPHLLLRHRLAPAPSHLQKRRRRRRGGGNEEEEERRMQHPLRRTVREALGYELVSLDQPDIDALVEPPGGGRCRRRS